MSSKNENSNPHYSLTTLLAKQIRKNSTKKSAKTSKTAFGTFVEPRGWGNAESGAYQPKRTVRVFR